MQCKSRESGTKQKQFTATVLALADMDYHHFKRLALVYLYLIKQMQTILGFSG